MNARTLPGRRREIEIPRGIVIAVLVLVCGALVFVDRAIYFRSNQIKALDHAVSDSDLDKVKAMLKEHPGLVSWKDRFGRTPLHYAAHDGSRDVTQLLLASNADVNARTGSA